MRSTALVFGAFAMVCGAAAPTTPGQIDLRVLAAAPVRAFVGGKMVRLETYLWRNFMLPLPPEGRPLIGVLTVKTADGSALPADLAVEAVWIVRGDEIWTAPSLEQRPRAEPPRGREIVVRGGPKWKPGIAVDAIVRIRDGAGRTILLRAPKQKLRAVS